jgi:hypothetical protein
MKTRTLYDVLQVTPNAAPQILRAAHDHLSAHYDLAGDPAAKRLVEDAYATLTDPAARAAYDLKLSDLEAQREQRPLPAPENRKSLPAWGRVVAIVAAIGVGYGAATMWHQRVLTRMVLEHQAQLVERQAQIQQLRMERLDARTDRRAETYAAERQAALSAAEERQRQRELEATRNRLDRQAAELNRERELEAEAREREARRRAEQERRERAAADARNAALAQQRLAQEKAELERMYRENYPQYR